MKQRVALRIKLYMMLPIELSHSISAGAEPWSLNRVSKVLLGLLFALTASVVLADNQPAGDLTLDRTAKQRVQAGLYGV